MFHFTSNPKRLYLHARFNSESYGSWNASFHGVWLSIINPGTISQLLTKYSTGGEKVINSTPAMHSRVVWTNYLVNRGETILDYILINCTNKLIKASRAVNAMLTNQNTRTNNGDSRVMIFTCGLKMFTWKAFIKNTMISDGYDIIFRSQSACNKTFIHVA